MLGPLGIYKFLGTKAEGFTPEQQGMIAKYFESKGLLSRSAPEGVLSAKSIARNLDIDPELLRKEIANMGSPLGEVQSFKFGSRITEGYTTEQQEIIEKYLRKRGMLIEVSGDRIVSVSSFAQELGINPQTVASAYKKLRGVLGPMTSYRFINGSSVSGLNTEQQEKIKIHLAGRHIFARNAPEGVLSVKNLAKRLKVNPDVLRIEVKAISDLLGDVEYFKFNSIRAVGYTPEQQEMIAQMLRERGLIS